MATQTKLITYDDYRDLPDDGKRYEIIGGELYMTASPRTEHERISRKLLVKIDSYIGKHNGGEVFDAPFDVVLSMTDVVQPDLMFISNERSHIISENNIIEAPDLVVEIISEGTKIRDQTTKKTLYEKYGVKEYWIIYPDERKVEQFILRDQCFILHNTFQQNEVLTSELLGKFSMKLDKIFAG